MDLLSRFGVYASVATGVEGPDGTSNYVPITIQASEVPSALSDFPVYVDLSDLPAGFWSNVQNDGGDIRVTTSDGVTRVPVELVAINTPGETGELHFLATSVSSSSDTEFRLFYNAETTLSQPSVTGTYGRNAVWADYEAVWHLQEDPSGSAPQIVDSTGNSRDATSVGSMTSADSVSGKLGGNAIDFDGSNDRLAVSSFNVTNITVQAWINADTLDSGGGGNPIRLVSKYPAGGSILGGLWIFDTWDGNTSDTLKDGLRFAVGGIGTAQAGPGTLSAGSWLHVAGTYDGSSVAVHLNGVTKASTAASGSMAARTQGIGIAEDNATNSNTNEYFNGKMDEVRIKGIGLPVSWLASEYTNQNTPSTFYNVGSEVA